MATPTSTSNRVFVSERVTRVVLMEPEEMAIVVRDADHTPPNYIHLVTLKLLLPEAAGRLIIPRSAMANALLADLSTAALRRFTEHHRIRRQREQEGRE